MEELNRLQQSEGGPNHVLRVVVENMVYNVTLDVFYQIFSKFGQVLKIITFTKNSEFQIFKLEYRKSRLELEVLKLRRT